MVIPKSGRKRTLAMVLMAQLGALMFVLKMAMAALPNIEPVTLLTLVFTVTLGRWTLVPLYIYVLLEFLIWGVNTWSICYLYVWTVPLVIGWLLRKVESPLGWAVLAAAFGLAFGLLCTPVYVCIGGWAYALSWWASGLPFDLLHCGGNFVMVLVLFKPLRRLMETLLRRAGLAGTPTGA